MLYSLLKVDSKHLLTIRTHRQGNQKYVGSRLSLAIGRSHCEKGKQISHTSEPDTDEIRSQSNSEERDFLEYIDGVVRILSTSTKFVRGYFQALGTIVTDIVPNPSIVRIIFRVEKLRRCVHFCKYQSVLMICM